MTLFHDLGRESPRKRKPRETKAERMVRLTCLELAATMHADTVKETIVRAEAYYAFYKRGPVIKRGRKR